MSFFNSDATENIIIRVLSTF